MKRQAGINVRFVASRASAGQLAWGLFVDVMIKGERYRPTKFFATEAEAEAEYPVACAAVATLRGDHEENERRIKALAVPPLPAAPKGVELFETAARRWLDEYVLRTCTAASYRSYLGDLERHLFPIIRTWPMTPEVMTKTRLIGVLRDQLRERGCSLHTRLSCQRCVRALFTWVLVFDETTPFTKNPLEKLGKFVRHETEKRVKRKADPNPMTRVQAEAFLGWIFVHYRELWEWFLLLIDAGPRIGEVSALKWSPHLDDLDAGKAHIVESFSSAERWLAKKRAKAAGDDPSDLDLSCGEKDTKTHRENQYIDLSPRLQQALQALRIAERKKAFLRGRKTPQHVFVTRNGTPRRPDKMVYRAMREACAALNLKGRGGKPFTPHCLRDTFATLAILAGKHIGWVSMMLGHEDEQTTRDFYYKWIRLVDENPLAGERS